MAFANIQHEGGDRHDRGEKVSLFASPPASPTSTIRLFRVIKRVITHIFHVRGTIHSFNVFNHKSRPHFLFQFSQNQNESKKKIVHFALALLCRCNSVIDIEQKKNKLKWEVLCIQRRNLELKTKNIALVGKINVYLIKPKLIFIFFCSSSGVFYSCMEMSFFSMKSNMYMTVDCIVIVD